MIYFGFFITSYLIGYIFIAIVAYLIFTRLCEISDSTALLCYASEYNTLEYYKDSLSLILAITWPVSWFFICGCCIGSEFYTKKIIKGNEEIRIAAWFV